jgi:predicted metal-dependent phosphoesterase TrpH
VATIDLHLHTTASDGRCTPTELVGRAARLGLTTISVTDHDTMAGVVEATEAAREAGIALIPGIEITAVHGGKDVHVLGYNLPEGAPSLARLVADQRSLRLERAREIIRRLERMGAPIDADGLFRLGAASGKALARPHIAQSLVAAGHASSVAEAFERFIGDECGAYVPHQGASPGEVVEMIRGNGGIAAFAHPARTNRDELIAQLVEVGLNALEVYHCAHDAAAQARYEQLARYYGLCSTGGSDYHGEGTRYAELFGVVGMPATAYEAFQQCLTQRAAGRSLA